MYEYILWILWQQFEGERCLAEALGPLFRVIIPSSWWFQLEQDAVRRELALHLIPGDPDWLMVEFPRHVAHAQRIARAILRKPDEADEAVGTALMRTERVPYVPNNFGAYLDRAVRMAACDIKRWHARHSNTVSLDDIASHYDLSYDSPSPEEQAIRFECVEMVREALSRLSQIERTALVLHYLEGWTIKETALALGVHRFTGQNILQRARRKLVKILSPKLYPQRPHTPAAVSSRLRALARPPVFWEKGDSHARLEEFCD